ncbi:hypothetical protein ACM61V_13875 [Sphingomonas sp. TX0543]|uniref:hypothetical protein n=1 Tax=unclassified Sphingomonas TaxID=196159 RepID=UPI0010F592EF|nr:hypothetical protein [Sphingomonas sp. 3P27F8]
MTTIAKPISTVAASDSSDTRRARSALQSLNFSMADMQAGIGPLRPACAGAQDPGGDGRRAGNK